MEAGREIKSLVTLLATLVSTLLKININAIVHINLQVLVFHDPALCIRLSMRMHAVQYTFRHHSLKTVEIV